MFKNNPLKKIPRSPRACYTYTLLFCLGLIGFAIYLQTVMSLAPCPLCEIQRLVFLLIAFVSVIALLLKPSYKGICWFSGIIAILALLGALIAGHQVWLEIYPPPPSTSCGMSLSYLFKVLPFSSAVKMAILGTGDCAVVTWRLLGLSIPAWSFLSFIALSLLSFYTIKVASK
ncbi:MAG: disulfide bond formation protein B [Legionellales bacterium]|nr:disulfide bond formation protein B [Legionellales bacterium]